MGPSGAAEPTARDLWLAIEPIHAVVYFASEIQAALADAGTKGFWMGYFGARAAPMGAVAPGVVQATFYNFAPSMVERAVPDVWGFVGPERLVEVRRTASARLLASVTGDLPADAVAVAADHLEEVVAALDTVGRPHAAANQALGGGSDPYQRLWQATTTLREHRGDGHVALLVANGLDGVEVHVLQAATGVVPRDRLQGARGWTDEQWDAAAARLVDRGWIDGAGALTSVGRDRRSSIEDQTAVLATVAGVDLAAVIDAVVPVTAAVAAADVIMYPNPIGLPSPS
jgi:hypothetical protein